MEEPKSKPPQDIVAEIGVDDLYDFLGVDSTSNEKAVRSKNMQLVVVSLARRKRLWGCMPLGKRPVRP